MLIGGYDGYGDRAQLVAVRRGDRYVVARSDALGDELGGWFKNIGRTLSKAVTDTGHAVGAVATSSIGQGILAGTLALTGVGLPAAIAIGAGVKAGGALIKSGGNLGTAGTAAYQGAAVGAGAAIGGDIIRGAGAPNLHLPVSLPAAGTVVRAIPRVAVTAAKAVGSGAVKVASMLPDAQGIPTVPAAPSLSAMGFGLSPWMLAAVPTAAYLLFAGTRSRSRGSRRGSR